MTAQIYKISNANYLKSAPSRNRGQRLLMNTLIRAATQTSGDPLSTLERSKQMALVHHKNTKPELAVRCLTHAMGYRYRLHVRALPGQPDLVFASRRKVIFVHGCFWHRHRGCPNCRLPKSKLEFWEPKLEGNRRRDRANLVKLLKLGWKSLVIWECEIKDQLALAARIKKFLEEG